MILKKIGGKSFVVNLLADFILGHFPKEENSIIKVVDCENFFVIKGKTTSKQVLSLQDILSEFNEKFKIEPKITHTIDLIEYDIEIKNVEEVSHTYHNNTPNCSYHHSDLEKEQIETDDIIFVSSFPHGYSLNQGRLLYYYGKKIFYNIPSNYPITSLTFNLSTQKNSNGDLKFSVIDEFSKNLDETLTSAILDVFDFNYEKLENEMKKVDWTIELTDPLSEYDFLKEKIEGFVII